MSQMSFSKDRAGASMLIDNFVTLCGSPTTPVSHHRFFHHPGCPLTVIVRAITQGVYRGAVELPHPGCRLLLHGNQPPPFLSR